MYVGHCAKCFLLRPCFVITEQCHCYYPNAQIVRLKFREVHAKISENVLGASKHLLTAAHCATSSVSLMCCFLYQPTLSHPHSYMNTDIPRFSYKA